jgi:hypothetical protein
MQWLNPFNCEVSNISKPENLVQLVAVAVESLQQSGAVHPSVVSADNFHSQSI